jgi:putative FmdB family regulatory protein
MTSDDATLALGQGECQCLSNPGGSVPTYQYTCTECGQSLEAVQSFSDPALTECPACEGKLRKVFNSVGIVFKGSGFYRTDSRAGAVGSETAKSDAAATKAESSTSAASTSSGDKSGSTSSSSTSSSNGSSSNGSSSSKGGASKSGSTPASSSSSSSSAAKS